jgi:hypothetical protein
MGKALAAKIISDLDSISVAKKSDLCSHINGNFVKEKMLEIVNNL